MSISSKQFQIVFEHSPMGMVILDFSGYIILSNKLSRSMFETCSNEKSWERSFLNFIHPKDREGFDKKFKRLKGKPNSRFNMEARFSCGKKLRWCRLAMTHVGQGDFSPFIFGIIEDITQRKITEEKLIREKETAEKATETKSAFLANMSHEIRTPIHTITGMVDLLLETMLDAEQQEYAGQIRYSADSLLGLINDILDFSKIESGKLSLEIIECDLLTLISETVDMISLLAHKKNLEMILQMDRGVPRWVMGDPTRIRQILLNLLSNAVKFTSQGEVCVKVSPVHRIGNRQSIRVEVIDTGIGIKEDKLDMLFHSFTQVDSSTTRKYGGTGLGLSISKSFVQLMNGIIDVSSQVGEGSRFWFTLPLDIVLDREEMVEPMVEESVAQRPVLVVDDNLSSASVIRSYLSEWFNQVDLAATGKEALEKLKNAAQEENPYYVVLVDLHLPGMDGWQLASEIKNDPQIKDSRLFLMSPLGTGSEAKMKLLGWFDGYLNKPIKRDQLEDDLLEVLSTDTTLPLLEAAEEQEPRRGSLQKVQRLLVAEDHPVNQILFKTILEKMGYQVLLAANGRDAAKITFEERPDLIFMDIQMPEMNGYEATEKIRQSGLNLPIIAVTANVLVGEREKCLAAGMNDFLTKPFKARDLLPILEKWLAPTEEVPEAQDFPVEPEPEAAERESTASPGKTIPPSGTTEKKKVFDFSEALATFMENTEILCRALRSFEERTEAQLVSMRKALETGDWKRVEIESHGIKGGAWNLEARPLGDAAAALEAASIKQEAPLALEALGVVEKEFRELQRVLADLPELQGSQA